MPTPTTYSYDIALDFPKGKVNLGAFLTEIANSAISVAVLTLTTNGGATTGNGVVAGGALQITFKDALSDQTLLDGGSGQPYGTHPAGGLIAAHNDALTMTGEPVTVTNTPPVTIRQEAKTYGHYRIVPLEIVNIPAGAVQYKDWVTPDLTTGVDWLSAEFYAGDSDSGDMIATGKALFGQIAAVAAPASTGATTIMLAGPIGLLREMDKSPGGVIDEGFFLSFGIENSTDTAINAVSVPPGTGTLENPQPELTEYEIKRVGLPTPAGDGVNEIVVITFFTPLAADVAPGTNANLVVRSVHEAFSLTKGDRISIGGQQLSAGNLPAGKIVRFGYKNTGAAAKTARARFVVFY